MSTWITRAEPEVGDGPRVAVKDAIDVAGLPTTVGCRVVAEDALPAPADARCLAGFRSAGARILGKANLHELCFGGTGINPWFGTPVNPLDPGRVPGGSSSGSAVAVATGEADVALGTDSGGSIRTPAACCGVVGLKTTYGRVPLEGVWPLSPSLDVVGPLARDVAGVERGMALLEPGFRRAAEIRGRVARVRVVVADPAIDDALDAALAASGLEVVPVDLPGWATADEHGLHLLLTEALAANRDLVDRSLDRLDPAVQARFRWAQSLPAGIEEEAVAFQPAWRRRLDGALTGVDALALPAMAGFAAPLDQPTTRPNLAALAVNLAGNPAIAVPVPLLPRAPSAVAHLRASLQLVGRRGEEEVLVALAAQVEAAVH